MLHIVLPPSETKHPGGAGVLAPAALAHAGELGDTRAAVRAALETLSADPHAAARVLKLGARSLSEREHNLVLATSGVRPAIERYTGVLYDALGVGSLPAAARRWLGAHVSIQSALFGLLAAHDPIPAYRLSAGSPLRVDGTPLKATWRAAHAGVDWAALGWVLDLRSKDYAALAPLPPGAGASLQVAQRGPDGEIRALNHFNKAAKGDLVRRLALSRPRISGPRALIAWAAGEGLDLRAGVGSDDLLLVTDLGAPDADAARSAPTG